MHVVYGMQPVLPEISWAAPLTIVAKVEFSSLAMSLHLSGPAEKRRFTNSAKSNAALGIARQRRPRSQGRRSKDRSSVGTFSKPANQLSF
eukprot:885225-Amphidinium_carterae.1